MDLKRLLALLFAVAAIPLGLLAVGFEPRLIWAPQQLLLVFALPWVFIAFAFGPRALPRALELAFSSDRDDRPQEAREAAGTVLREVAGLSMAVGAASFLLDMLSMLQMLASTSGNAAPNEIVFGLGAALVGPVYGLILKAIIYDPLATAAEPTPGDLASAL